MSGIVVTVHGRCQVIEGKIQLVVGAVDGPVAYQPFVSPEIRPGGDPIRLPKQRGQGQQGFLDLGNVDAAFATIERGLAAHGSNQFFGCCCPSW